MNGVRLGPAAAGIVNDEQAASFALQLYQTLVRTGRFRPSFDTARLAVTSVWPDLDPIFHEP